MTDPSRTGSPAICRAAYFSGRVQGVGFRFTVYHLARGFPVAGFVRNLPDGRVELVAEGLQDQVDRFTEAIKQEMRGLVADVEVRDQPATGTYRRFEIRP
jgi:acylphosphatase